MFPLQEILSSSKDLQVRFLNFGQNTVLFHLLQSGETASLPPLARGSAASLYSTPTCLSHSLSIQSIPAQ